MTASFWREVAITTPRSRFFGLFGSPEPYLPESKRVSVPSIRPSSPRTRETIALIEAEADLISPIKDMPDPQQFLVTQIVPSANTVRIAKPSDPIETTAPSEADRIRLNTAARLPEPPPESVPSSLARRLAIALQPPLEQFLDPSGILEWPARLFEYQIAGVRALLSNPALLLADDMGLGKTVQVIAALRILNAQRRMDKALIVVPASLVGQWRREIKHWAPELRISTIRGSVEDRVWQWQTPANIYIVGYETLRPDFTSNPHSPPRRATWDVVVLDEAQKIKNRGVEISSKCKQLPRRRAWALTGTPLENKVDDLCSILEFVVPLSQDELPQRLEWNDETRDRHRRLQLRRRKSEVLPQLPPKVTSKIMLTLDGAQRESYDRAEKEGVLELRKKGETVRIQNVLELITRLKQICNFCPTSGQSAKLTDICQRLPTLRAENHRALIFSQFTDECFGVRAIETAITDENPLIFTGDLGPSRDAIIKKFKEDETHRVLVLSLRAGGQGLNLQEASYVFHFDRWWNPAVENQADARSHRMGQPHPVTVYKYVCEGTIEERIDELLVGKQSLFDDLVDDVSIDLRASLSAEQLFGLFGLRPPEAPTHHRSAEEPADFSAMTGVEFETHVQRLLERRGWSLETTPASRDGGIDLIARRTDDVGLTIALYIQCKNHSTPVTVEIVRELNGVLPRLPGVRGVVTCPNGFTADAKRFAEQKQIVLWARTELFELRARDTA